MLRFADARYVTRCDGARTITPIAYGCRYYAACCCDMLRRFVLLTPRMALV